MSSSEEQETFLSPNPFKEARRSKKYTSKKSYKEYLRTRQQSQQVTTSNSSSPVENNFLDNLSSTPTPVDEYNNDLDNKSEKDSIIVAGKENTKQNAKFSLIMNDIHGIKLKKLNHDDTHSTKINRMHGINQHHQLQQSQQSQTESQQNESKEENLITITNVNEDKTVYNNMMMPINLIVNSSATTATATATEQETRSIGDEPNPNPHSSITGENEVNKTIIDLDASKKKYTEGMDVKRRIAIATDDWYVSASDADDTDTLMGKSHCATTKTVNPVLECVNQVYAIFQLNMN